jgi:hypothetical protein
METNYFKKKRLLQEQSEQKEAPKQDFEQLRIDFGLRSHFRVYGVTDIYSVCPFRGQYLAIWFNTYWATGKTPATWGYEITDIPDEELSYLDMWILADTLNNEIGDMRHLWLSSILPADLKQDELMQGCPEGTLLAIFEAEYTGDDEDE